VALPHEAMIGIEDHPDRRIGLDPEDRVWIFGPVMVDADVVRPDAGVFARIEAEMPCDLAQIGILGRADPAIGERNMKEAPEQVLKYGTIGGEQTPDLPGVAVEAGGALAGEIEDQPDMIVFAGRNLKHLAKGGDLV